MVTQSLFRYLNSSTPASLDSFELARLNARSNTWKKLTLVLTEYLEEESASCLARLLRSRTHSLPSGASPAVHGQARNELDRVGSSEIPQSLHPSVASLSTTVKNFLDRTLGPDHSNAAPRRSAGPRLAVGTKRSAHDHTRQRLERHRPLMSSDRGLIATIPPRFGPMRLRPRMSPISVRHHCSSGFVYYQPCPIGRPPRP